VIVPFHCLQSSSVRVARCGSNLIEALHCSVYSDPAAAGKACKQQQAERRTESTLGSAYPFKQAESFMSSTTSFVWGLPKAPRLTLVAVCWECRRPTRLNSQSPFPGYMPATFQPHPPCFSSLAFEKQDHYNIYRWTAYLFLDAISLDIVGSLNGLETCVVTGFCCALK
jgi:hypothetical protein